MNFYTTDQYYYLYSEAAIWPASGVAGRISDAFKRGEQQMIMII